MMTKKLTVGKKRPKHEREAARAEVPRMYAEGMTLAEIGAVFGVSAETVRKDMAVVYKRWIDDGKKNFGELIQRELLTLDRVELEAWAAWEKSLQDSVTYTTSDKDGNKESRTGQSGNPRFLDIVKDCLQRRAKLLGYDAPEKSEMKIDTPPAVNISFG